MSHGIARLSQRLRRRIKSEAAKPRERERPDSNGQQAGPGACRFLTTSQLHPHDQDDQHQRHLQQHHQLASGVHESGSSLSSTPAGYLSSAEAAPACVDRGAAASVSAPSVTRDDQLPDKAGQEEGHHHATQHPHNNTAKFIGARTTTAQDDVKNTALPSSAALHDRATSSSLGQSVLATTTTTTTTLPATASDANTASSSPPIYSTKPHSCHIANTGTATSIPPSFLQAVDERDGASPAAVDADSIDLVDNLPPDRKQSISTSIGAIVRKQSLIPQSQQHLVNRVLEGDFNHRDNNSFTVPHHPAAPMAQRKIWVKRPDASATLVTMPEDSVVDELRDHVLRKYSNSLGRTYDAPDLLVRICPRTALGQDRILSPEESLFPLIDQNYPGGQTMAEALIVEAPQRRTPMKPSPRQSYYYHAEPGEHGEYFPLMPAPMNARTPPAHPSSSSTNNVSSHQTPSMSVLTTGKVPPLPSPGSRANRHARRPPFARHPTSSPTLIGPAKDANIAVNGQAMSSQPSLPTPPAPAAPASESPGHNALKNSTAVASPRIGRKSKKVSSPNSGGLGGLIEGTVPPINVLIVEDNVINQKLLEAFMKRLSVRWQCAPNGEVAVKKWRQGGFHLVLMDIQLPVMNGLDATKEIRRLERLNGIGVFSKTASGRSSAESTGPAAGSPLKEEDTLQDLSLFKSPVIVVALTASSLQSDRHEALAAGCNDFLTKPIGFPWLEQKVTEWGCMQALIDFEGWRKWRGYEDSPRHAHSTQSGHQNPRLQAIKVVDTKPATNLSTIEGDSGTSSGRDEDGEVPGPVPV